MNKFRSKISCHEQVDPSDVSIGILGDESLLNFIEGSSRKAE